MNPSRGCSERPRAGVRPATPNPATMTRSLALAATAALLGAAVVTPARAADWQVALLAYRTTRGAGSLEIQVGATPGDQPSAVAVVVGRVAHGRLAEVGFAEAQAFGAANHAQVRGNGGSTVLCDAGACAADTTTLDAGLALTVTSKAGDDLPNVVLVVAQGPKVVYTESHRGWAVKRITLPFRWVTGQDSAVLGAWAMGSGAEVFTDASLKGGATGSVAIGRLPCSAAAVGLVGRGVASATLDGGRAPRSTSCAGSPRVAAIADGRTTWRLHGNAAGDTTDADLRLLVLDLPRTLPFPRTYPWR
jgi:hypothetical protein